MEYLVQRKIKHEENRNKDVRVIMARYAIGDKAKVLWLRFTLDDKLKPTILYEVEDYAKRTIMSVKDIKEACAAYDGIKVPTSLEVIAEETESNETD